MTTHRKILLAGTAVFLGALAVVSAVAFPSALGQVQRAFAAQIEAPATPAVNTEAPFPDGIRGSVCQDEANEIVSHLADKSNLATPEVVLDVSNTHSILANAGALYDVETGTIYLATCVKIDVLVHEFGHHVMQERAGRSWPAHLKLAQSFCIENATCEGLWVEGEPFPGVEHAAHCIGNMIFVLDSSLGAPSDRTYTKCYGMERTRLAAHILEDPSEHGGHSH